MNAEARTHLLPVARSVFWWGRSEDWLDETNRFVAQVMTYGNWDEVCLVAKWLGEDAFQRVLAAPPPGVFDSKSWVFWHHRYHLEVPALPARQVYVPTST